MKEYTEQELAEISKEIDGMDAICEKGRKQVKRLVGILVGKNFAEPVSPAFTSQIWGERKDHLNVLIVPSTKSGDLLSAVAYSQSDYMTLVESNMSPIDMAMALHKKGWKPVGKASISINPL